LEDLERICEKSKEKKRREEKKGKRVKKSF